MTTRTTRPRSRVAARASLLGPAFVAGIAYVDPGNVATNTAAGARFGYLLVWVLVVANLMAIVVQYLSAKVGLATGKSLPRLCRDHYSGPTVWALWVQAELIALATDLAEVIGGALALYLLFGMPLVWGGVLTGLVSLVMLLVQGRRHQQSYERVVITMMLIIVVGFVWSLVVARPEPGAALHGLVPRFEGKQSLLLATGMLGATVMPHAIYLHSSLVIDRFGDTSDRPALRREVFRATKVDVLAALAIAGGVNITMLLVAASALRGLDISSIEEVHAGITAILGGTAGLLFAIALLASGLSSSSVGTYAGSVILDGFIDRHIPVVVRRLITLVPAILLLQTGIDPTRALIASQVVLSLGIPFALFPLVRFTRDATLMGDLVNRRSTTAVAFAIAVLISALNAVLVVLTVG